jgi:hypothetical protein
MSSAPIIFIAFDVLFIFCHFSMHALASISSALFFLTQNAIDLLLSQGKRIFMSE